MHEPVLQRAAECGDEDLARAIEESLRAAARMEETRGPVEEEIDESRDVVPREFVTDREGEANVVSRDGDEDEDDEVQITAAELDVEARVLGSKEFAVDDEALDSYLNSVLQWWFGERPPKGVDVELTRRCLSVCLSLSLEVCC